MHPATHTHLRAKDSGETMLAHTLHVVRIARQICANLPFPAAERAALTPLLVQLAAFHDLGKCASGFQAGLRQKQAWGHRHEILSTSLATQLNPQLEAAGLLAIITHHRNLPPWDGTEQEKCLPDDELPYDDAPVWRTMVAELQENSAALQAFLDELARLGVCLRHHFLALGFGAGQLGLYLLGMGQALSDLLTPHLQQLEDSSIGEPVQDGAYDAEAGYLGQELRPVYTEGRDDTFDGSATDCFRHCLPHQYGRS